MDDKQITMVVEEAAKILRDYPYIKYKEAIEKAKEMINNGHSTMHK